MSVKQSERKFGAAVHVALQTAVYMLLYAVAAENLPQLLRP